MTYPVLDLSPIEIPRDTICIDCEKRPRCMVFFPGDQGSFLSVKCERCCKARDVLLRLEGEEK